MLSAIVNSFYFLERLLNVCMPPSLHTLNSTITVLKKLTALPVGVAHLEVTAGSGGVLAGSIGAADLLNLLAKALQGAVHLQIAVAENVGVISAVHAEGIRCLLLWLGDEAEVESATRGTRCSRRTRRSRRSLRE